MMLISKVFSLALMWYVSSASFGVTDFHLTTATVIHSAEDRSMLVEVELYAINLNELMTQLAEFDVDISKPKDFKVVEELMDDYVAQNFLFIQKGRMLPLSVTNIKVEDEKVFLILDVEIDGAGELSLKNTLFFDVYTDQINVVKIESGANSDSYYFNKQTPEQTVIL